MTASHTCAWLATSVSDEPFSGELEKMRRLLRAGERGSMGKGEVAVSLRTLKSDFLEGRTTAWEQAASGAGASVQE